MIRAKSCGAIIFRIVDNKPIFLLLQKDSGYWAFMKGRVELGEEELDTVKRESEEETGIKDLKFIKGFREGTNFFFKRDGNTIAKEEVYYLAQTKIEDIRLSSEHTGYKWLNYEDALKQLTFDNSRGVLRKAMEFLSSSTS